MPVPDLSHAYEAQEGQISIGSAVKSQAAHQTASSLEDPFVGVFHDSEYDAEESTSDRPFEPSSPIVQEPSLPPTPPLNQSFSSELQQPDSVGSHASGFVTPTNARSPPTPDITPPRIRDILTKLSAGSFQSPSSYAESFKTAHEDQISLSTRNSSDAVTGMQYHQDLGYLHQPDFARAATSEDVFASLNEPVTAPRHSLRHKPDFHVQNGVNVQKAHSKLYEVSYQSSDSDINGDVTPRYLMHPKVTYDSGYTSALPRDPVTQERISSRPPEKVKYEHMPSKNIPKSDSPNEFDLKRLSGTSGSSTVVEAMVIDRTPPSYKRKLRHVSKTESLRSSASPQPNHFNDLESPRLGQQNSLRRRKATIAPRPVTAPHEESNAGEEDVLESLQNQRRVVSDPLQPFAMQFADVTPPPPSASPASLVTDTYYDAMPLKPSESKSSLDHAQNRLSVPGAFPVQDSESQWGTFDDEADGRSLNTSLPPSAQSIRQLYGASPMSLKSETTDNFEINEASVVKLSAHTNNSLVVVNNTSSNDILKRQTVAGPPAIVTRPAEATYITIDPLTPTSQQQEFEPPLSPLRNPRAAPEPPIIAVAPATPSAALDEMSDESKAELSDESKSKTRGSLFTRARKYSGSLMQPISGTFRRSRYSNGKHQSTPAADSSTTSERNSQIHPLWQPQGSSAAPSDGEQEGYYDRGAEGPANPSVVGATASQSAEPSRRLGSVRGFLIGNSLGLERGPTNRRRHVISLPGAKKRTQQQKALPQRNPTHVTVRQSVKRSGSGRSVQKSRTKVVFRGWRERIRERRWRMQERSKEKRRTELRNSIEGPFQQETGMV